MPLISLQRTLPAVGCCLQTFNKAALCVFSLALLGSIQLCCAKEPFKKSSALVEVQTEPAVEVSRAEQFFKRALALRDSRSPSEKDLQKAVDLLYAAAGIEHLSMSKNSSFDAPLKVAGTDPMPEGARDVDPSFPYQTSAAVTVKWRNDTIQHVGAVRELIYVFRDGDGAPANPAIAHRLLEELAALGNAEAQADVATYLALGLEPVAPNPHGHIFAFSDQPDVPAALVYYYFAAKSGDPIAQMALGYRHYSGYDVPKNCKIAALYYAPVAERVLELAKVRDGLPDQNAIRLSHRAIHSRARLTAEQEYLHYKWFADYGHADAARAVAHLVAHGAAQEFTEAVGYLQRAAGAGDIDAMAHLGHMYANGIAVKQDNNTAWRWFWRAAEQGHPSGLYGLGYMHLTGQGADVDYKQAFQYFKQAVEGGKDWLGLADGLFYLGTMYLKGWGTPADISQASAYFSMSARSGNMLAAYNLAVLHLREMAGEKGDAACKAAVGELKRVAERGWPALSEGADDFAAGDYEWALLNFLKASEWGSELGQSNAAWMLQEGYGYDGPLAGEVAVRLLQRAAEQGNAAALVRVGDAYWYGKGVTRDWTRAGSMYEEAARHRVAQALFNLGYMHQHGAGVPQDFPLSKRYYDRAAEAATDAKLPTAVALIALRVHRWWNRVEPRLPRRWAWLWKDVMIVKEERLPLKARRVGATNLGVLARMRRALSLSTVIDALDRLDESFDASLIGWIVGILGLVLWRRQALRARQAPVAAVPRPPQPPAAQGIAPVADPPPPSSVHQQQEEEQRSADVQQEGSGGRTE